MSKKPRKKQRRVALLSRERNKPASQQSAAQQSQSPEQPAAEGIALLEEFDGFANVRNALRKIAKGMGEWAGLPMPLEGSPLVIEPNFPNAEILMTIGAAESSEEPDTNIELRNIFYSRHWRCDIVIYEEDGRIQHAKLPAFHGLGNALSTLGAADAWGIEQEAAAVNTLARLVSHRKFKQYMLTSSFLEKSERSGLTYMFRRLRPTVVLTPNKDKDAMRILCALCQHPIGYYRDSWAGAMCPTDDVIAHLMLMRGDEHMFWKRSNQHPAYRPEAGLS